MAKLPAVMRRKFDKPDAAGILCGGRPSKLTVNKVTKNNPKANPCTGRHECEEAGVGGELSPHVIGGRVKAEGGCGKDARIEAPHQGSDHERGQHGRHATRGGDHAGPGGRVAQEALQPQGKQDDIAEVDAVPQAQRYCAERKVARLEQAQVHDGMLVGELPYQPRGEANAGDEQQDHDGGRVEPVEILALIEHDLQRAHPQEQQQQADAIDGQLLGRRFVGFEIGRPGESRASRLIRPYEPRRPRCIPGAYISHIHQRAL